MLRIERKQMLQPFDNVGRKHGDKRKDEHDHAVLGPPHLAVLIDAGEAVKETLDGTKDGIGKGALAFEDTRHVNA